jgi:hypothetical protein
VPRASNHFRGIETSVCSTPCVADGSFLSRFLSRAIRTNHPLRRGRLYRVAGSGMVTGMGRGHGESGHFGVRPEWPVFDLLAMSETGALRSGRSRPIMAVRALPPRVQKPTVIRVR